MERQSIGRRIVFPIAMILAGMIIALNLYDFCPEYRGQRSALIRGQSLGNSHGPEYLDGGDDCKYHCLFQRGEFSGALPGEYVYTGGIPLEAVAGNMGYLFGW